MSDLKSINIDNMTNQLTNQLTNKIANEIIKLERIRI